MSNENNTCAPEVQSYSTDRLLPSDLILSQEQENAVELVCAGKNVVLLGKAGVGKSTAICAILNGLEDKGKKYIVCAPTGVAAINVGGITVHRLISILRKGQTKHLNNGAGFETLVVDEASMLRADLFDELDAALKAYGYDSRAAFGGIQVILVGDPGQLPPVINTREAPEEAAFLKSEYFSEFFFSAACYSRAKWEIIELTHIFRQEGKKYPMLLNMIRAGESTKSVKYLNSKHVVSAPVGVVLTGRNADAAEINKRELAKLPGERVVSRAEMNNVDPEYVWKKNEYPADEFLDLKIGARVMIIKNIYRPSEQKDEDGKYLWNMVLSNGDIGTIEYMDEQIIELYVERLGRTIEIDKHADGTWEKKRVKGYEEIPVKDAEGQLKKGDDGKPKTIQGRPKSEVVAYFVQFPLRLAYAMTVHKAQGATISEPFTVDVRRPMFAAGQLYVALSRGTKLENLNILGRVKPRDVIASAKVNAYLDGYMAGVGIKKGSTFEQLQKELDMEDTPEEIDELDKMLAMEQEPEGGW